MRVRAWSARQAPTRRKRKSPAERTEEEDPLRSMERRLFFHLFLLSLLVSVVYLSVAEAVDLVPVEMATGRARAPHRA